MPGGWSTAEVTPDVEAALDHVLTRRIKDIKVWGTVHEGRVLPVGEADATTRVGWLPVPTGQTFRGDVFAAAANDGHEHHSGCICSLNRMFSQAVFGTDR